MILLPLSAAVVTLYFYERSRRRQVVSSLQFWPKRPDPPMVTRRRKLQQPVSLLLQLLALLLLVLAIADPRWDERVDVVRRHVVILDCSAWMGAVTSDGQPLISVAGGLAQSYIDAVPNSEPVMLIRGDANPTPITPFTTNRQVLKDAVQASKPSWNAIDLNAAFEVAHSALSLHGTRGGDLADHSGVGEVTYVGSSRTVTSNIEEHRFPRVRWIEVHDNVDDRGVTQLIARRLVDDPEVWEVGVKLLQVGERAQEVKMEFLFAGKMLGSKVLALPANGTKELTFKLRTRRAGRLEVRLGSLDHFAPNDSASLDLPGYHRHQVDVYSNSPHGLRSLLEANSSLDIRFYSLHNYLGSTAKAIVFNEFSPEVVPQSNLIYINPSIENSPVEVLRVARAQRITRWSIDHAVARGLRTRDIVLDKTLVFNPRPDDVIIAESEAGPVVIARVENGHKKVVFGFNFADRSLRNRPAAPLLFANTMSWIFPDMYRISELRAQSPGLIEIEVGDTAERDIVIHSDEGRDIPWSYHAGKVRLFTSMPGSVVVHTPTTETHLALVLPEVPKSTWSPPEGVLHGIPPKTTGSARTSVFWPVLAGLALVCWLLEWRVFGRVPRRSVPMGFVTQRTRDYNLSRIAVGPAPGQGSNKVSKRPEEPEIRTSDNEALL